MRTRITPNTDIFYAVLRDDGQKERKMHDLALAKLQRARDE